MKKVLLSISIMVIASMAFTQQNQPSPFGNGGKETMNGISYAPTVTCDNEKGYYDFPFTENGITVTGSGTGTYTVYQPGWGSCGIFAAANCVWIGTDGPATYTNTFSSPVNNMIYNMTATDIGEVITITTDAGTPSITYTDGTCPSWFNISGNTITCVDGYYPAAGGRFLITSTQDFSSITFSHNGTMNGTTMTMCFDQAITPPPPSAIPVSNWALILGGALIATFVFVRFRRMF